MRRFASLLAASLFLATPALADPLKRAAWVVRDQLTSAGSVEKACGDARKAGLDTVIFQVRGRGDAYYSSELAPRAESLSSAPKTFDPLKAALDDCKGMRVVAWINAFLVWGGEEKPKAPNHVVNAREEWLLTDADGRKVSQFTKEERARGWIEGPYADPSSAEYRAHFAEIAAEIASRYRVDGIHLDFIRYPGPDYGRGGKLGEDYERRYGIDPRWLPTGFSNFDEAAFLSEATDPAKRAMMSAALLWADMRADEVAAAVRGVAKAARDVRPGVEISAAVFPDAGAAFFEKGQDWRGWMREGLVDAIFPMAYFGPGERVGGQLADVAAQAKRHGGKTRLWAGLGSYLKEPTEIARETAQAAKLGYEGVCLFDLASARKKGGLHEYTDKFPLADTARERPEQAAPKGDTPLAKAFYRAVALEGEGAEAVLKTRKAELDAFTRGFFPSFMSRAAKEGLTVPPWVEARGIFRYVHPLDPPAKKAEQLKTCGVALERARKGEDFSRLAAELSQDGTKAYGGRLERQYLGGERSSDAALAPLTAGDVSAVVEAPNGCWVYKVDSRGDGGVVPLEKADWPMRREALFMALAMDGSAKEGGGK